MDSYKDLPVAVIGAGPVGLAAAAHLLERGLEPLVFEAGPTVGAAIREWGHIRLFSPWQYNLDAAAVRLLEGTGWEAPRPTALPYGGESSTNTSKPWPPFPKIALRLQTGARVLAVTRHGLDKTHSGGRDSTPFVVRVGHDGRRDPRLPGCRAPSTPPAPGPPATRWGQPPACPPLVKPPPGCTDILAPARCPRRGTANRLPAAGFWWSAPATAKPTP